MQKVAMWILTIPISDAGSGEKIGEETVLWFPNILVPRLVTDFRTTLAIGLNRTMGLHIKSLAWVETFTSPQTLPAYGKYKEISTADAAPLVEWALCAYEEAEKAFQKLTKPS